MEKLLELLNEYRTEKGERNLNESEASQTLDSLNYLRLFIKWLVDNDKIDFSREGDLSIELVNLFERKLDNAEGVIALLSIQDDPIKFLISVLK